jgi:hypothetical protein
VNETQRLALKSAGLLAEETSGIVRDLRTRIYPEPHALEGAPLLVWQRLNQAQALMRKAADLLAQVADPAAARAKAIDPNEIADLEAMVGFDQAADEALSEVPGPSPSVIDTIAIDYRPETELPLPWRSGGEVPGG